MDYGLFYTFMSESKPKTPQEILASLGDKFVVTWDAFHESGNFSDLPENIVDKVKITDEKTNEKNVKTIEKTIKTTFNEEKFFEILEKIHPEYLKHAKSLFEADFANTPKTDAKLGTKEQEEQRKNYFIEIAQTFIKRIEFFSRLNPPEKVPTGGRTVEQLERAMAQANINISDYARAMMHKTTTTDEYGTFTTTKETKIIDFVRFKVKDLFCDSKNHTFKEIISKAKELGLELCESEDGPNYRLHYTNQPDGEWIWIGMKQISGSDGYPHVFELDRAGDGPWLHDNWTLPTRTWHPELEFVLRLSSSEPEKDKTQSNH